jgi:hypothetical protein
MRAGSFVAASLFGVFCVASPAAAGPPFLTDDPEPVDLGHWEVIGFSMGTVVRGDSAGTLPGVEVNYGALPGLQLHVKVPVSFNSQSVTGTESGYGDTEFGAKYRFINPGEDDWWPQVAVYPAVDLRTGNVPRGLGTGATHMFLPLWMQEDFWQVDELWRWRILDQSWTGKQELLVLWLATSASGRRQPGAWRGAVSSNCLDERSTRQRGISPRQ